MKTTVRRTRSRPKPSSLVPPHIRRDHERVRYLIRECKRKKDYMSAQRLALHCMRLVIGIVGDQLAKAATYSDPLPYKVLRNISYLVDRASKAVDEIEASPAQRERRDGDMFFRALKRKLCSSMLFQQSIARSLTYPQGKELVGHLLSLRLRGI
ncbi:MAG: hypothetical protein V4526_00205 [Patescibacteria group bacterium]